MDGLNNPDRESSALARRALFITAILAIAGAGLGLAGVLRGEVAGIEAGFICSALLFSSGILVALLVARRVALQTVATVSTTYFAVYLCACSTVAIIGAGRHLNLLIYLSWFFPLLVFNKLVNAPIVGRILAKCIMLAPLLILGALSPRLLTLFHTELLFVLVAFCLSYLAFGLMFNTVTRYREEFITERARIKSLQVESGVLESISDCFISVDSSFRLVYLNDSACSEFAVDRHAALKSTIPHAAPDFFSEPMLAGLQAASRLSAASLFEAQNVKCNLWYEMRCFPRPDGMSIYFRNITDSISSRMKLDQAHRRMRDQAELLDKAQDAIVVADIQNYITYWNESAERLYGWAAAEVIGRRVQEIFQHTSGEMNRIVESILKCGEWSGELSQRHRNGSVLTVESRCTLVSEEDGTPRSILAINTDVTNRKAAEAKIRHLAFFDPLTGLPNRMLLRERLDEALDSAIGRGTTGALLFIDLDDFKTLNDTLGHDIGDLLLREVGLRLTSCVRANDTVARLGGDEFVVLLEGLGEEADSTAAEVKAITDKILFQFLYPYRFANYEHNITASIGVTLFPVWSGTADDLLKQADMAMYRAKAQGRNAMCFFDPAMERLVASRAELGSDLRRALQNREFELFYQPQVDHAGNILGAEALLRWRHPRRGMVPPLEFIPVAEDAGLIGEIGRWVLETACAQIAQWSSRPEMAQLHVAVNVSVRQFLDPNFASLVSDVLEASGANPRRLKLEITESSLMERIEDIITMMTALKAVGVGFSLDDFGTGYSCLSHLKRLPLDQIKLDRSFVNDILTDARDALIARTIIMLGRDLNLSVIAEGVETEGQRQILEKLGCGTFQGYLASPALPVLKFEAFVTVPISQSDGSWRLFPALLA